MFLGCNSFVVMLLSVTLMSKAGTVQSESTTETMRGCSLQVERALVQDGDLSTKEDLQGQILKFKRKGDRMIKYELSVKKDNGPFSRDNVYGTMLLKPYDLVLILDDTGKALLSLKEYFIPMSLYTLGFGVEEIKVNLVQTPDNCLANVTAEDLEVYLRLLIFRNFENVTSDFSSEEVCIKVVRRKEDRTGEIKYRCCKLEFGDSLVCLDLEWNMWIIALLTIIIVLQVLFILYSPTFVPKKGRLSTKFLDYIYKPSNPLKLNIVVVDYNTQIVDKEFINAKQFPFIELSNLKRRLRKLPHGVLHTVTVSQVYLSVRASKIFPGGYSPVGFVKFIKNFFVRCTMRNSIPALKSCCKTDMFKKSGCCTLPWFKLLSAMMGLIAAGILTLPWIFRILFYYTFEDDLLEAEIRTFKSNELERSYPGSLILYLTPKHGLFIMIYVIILIDIVILIFLPPVAKRKLKFTIRMSLRNMTKSSKFDSFVLFLAHMLCPLEEFGILGCVVLIPFWLLAMPTGLLIVCYLIFPIINLSVRLLVNLVYYTIKFCRPGLYRSFRSNNIIFLRIGDVIKEWLDDVIVADKFERKSRRNMLFHVMSLALCMLTIAMLLILVVECIAFYIECAVYIVIGIILNSNRLMKFLSLTVLIAWYGRDCFGSVSTRYQHFAKVMNDEIQNRVGDIAKTVAMRTKEEQKEQAFTVPARDGVAEEKMKVFAGTEGFMKWDAKRLLLFLDKADIPYIPKNFLFKAANLGHFYCPGPTHMLYLNALVELLWITLFLGFVMLVILAFGEANNVSGANQTIATLASGFLPFAFRKCFAKSHSGPSIDKSNITWRTTLAEATENYSKRWTFSDFDISSCDPTEEEQEDKDLLPSVVSYRSQAVCCNQTVPGNVDIIVKVREGVKEKLEFWVRKAKKDRPKPKYIWRSRQVAEEKHDNVDIDAAKPGTLGTIRYYIWRSRQVARTEDVEADKISDKVQRINSTIIHIPL